MNKYALGKGASFNLGSLSGTTVVYRNGLGGVYSRRFVNKLDEENLIGYGDEAILINDEDLLKRCKSTLQII